MTSNEFTGMFVVIKSATWSPRRWIQQ